MQFTAESIATALLDLSHGFQFAATIFRLEVGRIVNDYHAGALANGRCQDFVGAESGLQPFIVDERR